MSDYPYNFDAKIVTYEFGKMKSSVVYVPEVNYTKEDLIGRQVIGVVNFPPKQIGPIMSEFLIVGFYRDDGSVILAVPDKAISNGAKLA